MRREDRVLILDMIDEAENVEECWTPARVARRIEGLSGISARRTLLRVHVDDPARTEGTIQTLMGKEVEPRFKFIMERAPRVGADDVDV